MNKLQVMEMAFLFGCMLLGSFVAPSDAQDKAQQLIDAVKKGDNAEVKSLIAAGVDVNTSVKGYTALIIASVMDHTDIVKSLIAAGARLKPKDQDTRQALGAAATRGNNEIVSALIKLGTDVNDTDNTGITALMFASMAGRTDVVRTLIAAGANLNSKQEGDGTTALVWAAMGGRPEVIKILVDAKADVNARTTSNYTALIWVSSEAMAETLRVGFNGKDATKESLDAFRRASDKDRALGAQILLDAGADVNAKNADGWTAIILASREGHTDVVRTLITAKADVNAKERGLGQTALMFASENGHTEIVKLLKQVGAKE